MSSEKQKWKKTLSNPTIMVLIVIWVVVSWLLWRTWKDGAPWPMGMAMPF
jgi:hypothetical protein